MTTNDWIELSDCPYTGKFLIKLLNENRLMKNDFSSIVKNNTMISKTLDFLKSHGLVDIQEVFKPYHTYWITLTDKGYMIALKYKAIKEIEDGIIPESENNYSASKESVSVMRKT